MSDTCLIEAAINNLLFLNEKNQFQGNSYKIVNNQFISSDDDNFDTIYSLSELEYPIYFTFHQILNHVNTSYSNDVCGYTRSELINYMDVAITNIFDHYLNIDEKNMQFELVIEDIEYKVDYVENYYKYGVFMFLPTRCKELFNHVCKSFISFSKDYVDQYYRRYTYNPDEEVNDDSESGEDESEDQSDDTNEQDSESCQEEEEEEEDNLKED